MYNTPTPSTIYVNLFVLCLYVCGETYFVLGSTIKNVNIFCLDVKFDGESEFDVNGTTRPISDLDIYIYMLFLTCVLYRLQWCVIES